MKPWTVTRWSGRDRDVPRKVFAGSEEKARARYVRLYREMRQGTVELMDGEDKTVDRAWAPRLRKSW